MNGPFAPQLTAARQKTYSAIKVGTEVAKLVPTHRECTVEITNQCSKYSLHNPSVHIKSGFCAEPLPPHIGPSTSGKALFTKTANSARGSVGVFTYDLINTSTKESSQKIAVMFSVPYDYNLYSNWYAVRVFEKSRVCDKALFEHMYHNADGMFDSAKAGSGLSHNKGEVTIMASMSDSSTAIIKVEINDNFV
uniref:uncharacterized protein n=1 Tax=Semicossyphus pulcher TaxID=241346 RepID=UPI0037E864CA